MSFVYLRCNIKVFTDVETGQEKRLSGSGEGRHRLFSASWFQGCGGCAPYWWIRFSKTTAFYL